MAGVSDNHQLVCLSLSMWNENDEILKEKAFGVTGPQGNHGEDVKEVYYYLDNTPSHSYMKYLYKYPQRAYPYKQLVEENAKRGYDQREFELEDTGIFEDNAYFDVVFEMAKADDEELYFRVTAYNRGAAPAPLHLLPHLVFRNTWSWGVPEEESRAKPKVSKEFEEDNLSVKVDHWKFGNRRFVFAPSPGIKDQDVEPTLLFTENETNKKRLYKCEENDVKYVKDAFHDYVIDDDTAAVNPDNEGTKCCAWFSFDEDGGVPAGDYVTVRYKLTQQSQREVFDEEEFDSVFSKRQDEADEFYWKVTPLPIPDTLRNVQRQAFAGLLWTKQFYHFVHEYWYGGDPASKVRPPTDRANGRNREWKHMYIDDVLSLPDKWEYPFFAAWDTAFHCVPFAMIDPDFAKKQLELLTREWYMHPNGQVPAYEWNFSDVNPPVHAWAAFRVYKTERKMYGRADREFLERVFQKLLLNFTWWVNRKDFEGKGVFEGGFLGLDNIGVFNRSEPLPTGGTLEQADSTGWMAFFSLQMLNIALELAKTNHTYEDIASKFFEHFLLISDAMTFRDAPSDKTDSEPTEKSLWNEEDHFYYDAISYGGPFTQQLPVRSLVGLIPLYASLTLEPQLIEKFPGFKKRLDWFINRRKNIAERNIASIDKRGVGERLLLSLVDKDRLVHILRRMLDESEFLSDYGIRSLSKYHADHPFKMEVHGQKYEVSYVSGESLSGLFGGNSNWRGPIWMPVNFLLIESLQRFFLYYGPEFKVECPVGSGEMLNLAQVAQELQHRLIRLFVAHDGERACSKQTTLYQGEHFKDYIPFYEYFDGDTGRGLGASHQCGWTALVAKWIQDTGLTYMAPSEECNQYYPRSEIPARLGRRRSTKSLIQLTANSLEMSEEEVKVLGRNGALSRRASSTRTPQAEGTGEYNEDLMGQIQKSISNYNVADDNGVSPDELEAHT